MSKKIFDVKKKLLSKKFLTSKNFDLHERDVVNGKLFWEAFLLFREFLGTHLTVTFDRMFDRMFDRTYDRTFDHTFYSIVRSIVLWYSAFDPM